jgi:hypothetical protein
MCSKLSQQKKWPVESPGLSGGLCDKPVYKL